MLGHPLIISEATANERAVLNRQMGIINVIDTSERQPSVNGDINGNSIMITMLSLVNQSQENASGGNTKVT